MAEVNWEVGAWYRHSLYPRRRMQITGVVGNDAGGLMYLASTKFGDTTTAWWPITVGEKDWCLCTKEDE